METSPLIYRPNQRTGFYLIETSVMKELKPFKMESKNKLSEDLRIIIE